MPIQLLAVVALCWSVAFAGEAPGDFQVIRGVVTRLADGDTLTLAPDNGGKPVTVRMVGVDTPELHLPTDGGSVSQGHWAETAAERLAELAPIGSSVKLETWGAQSYGRAIGRVIDSRGLDINLQMVKEGWAAAYVICAGETCKPGFLETQKVAKYMGSCEDAMSEGLGIYDPYDPLPEQPFEFRARIGKTKPYRPVGDLLTGILYSPESYPDIPLCRRIFFGSAADAARMGFQAERPTRPSKQ